MNSVEPEPPTPARVLVGGRGAAGQARCRLGVQEPRGSPALGEATPCSPLPTSPSGPQVLTASKGST